MRYYSLLQYLRSGKCVSAGERWCSASFRRLSSRISRTPTELLQVGMRQYLVLLTNLLVCCM